MKVCKEVFCITPMLTVLKKVFTASPLLEAISGYFLICLVVFFSISLEPFGFLRKYPLIFLIILWCLLDYRGLLLPFSWCYFEGFFLVGGRGYIFSIFLYFLRNMFHEIFQRYSSYYFGNHIKNNMARCLHFAGLFWIMLDHIFAHYKVLNKLFIM